MKILVTGATGFVGAAMIRHFAKLPNTEVIALGRQPNPPAELLKYAQYLRADLDATLPKITCDACIHTAAIADDTTSYKALHKTNVLGTQHLANALVGCQTFVHISSSSVYDTNQHIHDEYEQVIENQLFSYGKSKRQSEQILQTANHIPNIYILRPRAIYGCGDRVLLPRLLQTVRRGRAIVPGNLTAATSLTHILNLTQAAENCIAKHKAGFYIYNIADDKTYIYAKVFSALLSGVFHREIPFLHLPVAPILAAVGLLERLGIPTKLSTQSINTLTHPNILDITRAKRQLHYRPKFDLYSTLPDIIQWADEVGLQRLLAAEPDLPWRNFR